MISIQQIRFILGECPSGWLNAGELGGCYLFSPDGPGINWEQARAFCESVGGFLTDILNQETQDFIDGSGFFQSHPDVNWWIGANDIANVSHAIIIKYLNLHSLTLFKIFRKIQIDFRWYKHHTQSFFEVTCIPQV